MVLHQEHIGSFVFDAQGIQHKEFIPDGKRANAEFYKGVMDHPLKCIQQVHPAVFCSRDFFLLHDNAPTHKAAYVCKFLTPKNVNVTTLYHPSPTLQIYLCQTIFCSPS